MKTWAEKRKREVEALGDQQLAGMFELIIKLCELEEQTNFHPRNNQDAQLSQQSEARPYFDFVAADVRDCYPWPGTKR